MDKPKPINTKLPPAMIKQLKHLAVERGVTVQSLITQALSEFLGRKPTAEEVKAAENDDSE
jgi:hypothetical protein